MVFKRSLSLLTLLHLGLFRIGFAHEDLSEEPDNVDDPEEGQEEKAGQVVDPTDAQALLVTQVIQVHCVLIQLSSSLNKERSRLSADEVTFTTS